MMFDRGGVGGGGTFTDSRGAELPRSNNGNYIVGLCQPILDLPFNLTETSTDSIY